MNMPDNKEVQKLYDSTADSYDSMMDSEIKLPVYSDTLSRLAERISELDGPLIDVSCGSGHMLQMYHDKYDTDRTLIGIDISPAMIEVSRKRLGRIASLKLGDMSDLNSIPSSSTAALINFFAIHHIDQNVLRKSLVEWNRVLQIKGQLVIAAWEGKGAIDYGEHSDIIAVKHKKDILLQWINDSGFSINQYKVAFIEEMEMNAIYIEASKK